MLLIAFRNMGRHFEQRHRRFLFRFYNRRGQPFRRQDRFFRRAFTWIDIATGLAYYFFDVNFGLHLAFFMVNSSFPTLARGFQVLVNVISDRFQLTRGTITTGRTVKLGARGNDQGGFITRRRNRNIGQARRIRITYTPARRFQSQRFHRQDHGRVQRRYFNTFALRVNTVRRPFTFVNDRALDLIGNGATAAHPAFYHFTQFTFDIRHLNGYQTTFFCFTVQLHLHRIDSFRHRAAQDDGPLGNTIYRTDIVRLHDGIHDGKLDRTTRYF